MRPILKEKLSVLHVGNIAEAAFNKAFGHKRRKSHGVEAEYEKPFVGNKQLTAKGDEFVDGILQNPFFAIRPAAYAGGSRMIPS